MTAPRAHAKVRRRLNVLALENGVPPGAWTRVETSVNRLYELLSELSGKVLSPERGPAKPGEQLRSCVNPSLAGRVRNRSGWRW